MNRSELREIDAPTLKAWLDDDRAVLIDIREADEYAREHIAGSRLVPLSGFNSHDFDHDHGKIVVFHCNSGNRTCQAAPQILGAGFDEVYHLQGGILKYLEEIPEQESLWQGECFVFDERVTVNHRLEKGSYEQCHACRMPLSASDMASADYRPGVSCPHCTGTLSPRQRARFAEREKQARLASARGEHHMGSAAHATMQENRAVKQLRKERQRHGAVRQNARHR